MSKSVPARKAARRRLSPLAALKAFFAHDVRLRRDGRHLHFELVPRDAASATAPAAAAPQAAPAAPRFDELPMARALKVVLDAAPNSRRTLRHLAALERQIVRHGVVRLDALGLPALEVLLRQFDALVEPPLSQPLGELRAQIVAAAALLRRQMAQSLEEQRAAAATAAAAAHMEALHDLLGDDLRVSELPPSEVERSRAG